MCPSRTKCALVVRALLQRRCRVAPRNDARMLVGQLVAQRHLLLPGSRRTRLLLWRWQRRRPTAGVCGPQECVGIRRVPRSVEDVEQRAVGEAAREKHRRARAVASMELAHQQQQQRVEVNARNAALGSWLHQRRQTRRHSTLQVRRRLHVEQVAQNVKRRLYRQRHARRRAPILRSRAPRRAHQQTHAVNHMKKEAPCVAAPPHAVGGQAQKGTKRGGLWRATRRGKARGAQQPSQRTVGVGQVLRVKHAWSNCVLVVRHDCVVYVVAALGTPHRCTLHTVDLPQVNARNGRRQVVV
mmetsp:Transcript_9977/g.30108  ORF Transcript_9977/g.30108 Transcript_9977/m.30108 type:complete len:298 (+) Transcript_9977:235-1128(+)